MEATEQGMRSEALRIEHSIDAIERFTQVAPHYQWIKNLEATFSDIMGVGYVAANLRHQLYNIEL